LQPTNQSHGPRPGNPSMPIGPPSREVVILRGRSDMPPKAAQRFEPYLTAEDSSNKQVID
jgi:hypothetical protein